MTIRTRGSLRIAGNTCDPVNTRRVGSCPDVHPSDLRPPPHVGEHSYGARRTSCARRARRFLRFPNPRSKGSCHASRSEAGPEDRRPARSWSPTGPGRTSASRRHRSGVQSTCATATRRWTTPMDTARKAADVRCAGEHAASRRSRSAFPPAAAGGVRVHATRSSTEDLNPRRRDRCMVLDAVRVQRSLIRSAPSSASTGRPRAIVHLYNSIVTSRSGGSCSGLDRARRSSISRSRAARLCRELGRTAVPTTTDMRFEYSPESFTGDRARLRGRRVCEAVMDVVEPTARAQARCSTCPRRVELLRRRTSTAT